MTLLNLGAILEQLAGGEGVVAEAVAMFERVIAESERMTEPWHRCTSRRLTLLLMSMIDC